MRLDELEPGDEGILATRAIYNGSMDPLEIAAGIRVRVAWVRGGVAVTWTDPWDGPMGPRTCLPDALVADVRRAPCRAGRAPVGAGDDVDPLARHLADLPLLGAR